MSLVPASAVFVSSTVHPVTEEACIREFCDVAMTSPPCRPDNWDGCHYGEEGHCHQILCGPEIEGGKKLYLQRLAEQK